MTVHNGNEEQRAYKRFSADDNCWAQLDTSDKLTIKNISLFGTCLIIPRHLDKNSTSNITVYSGETRQISLEGCVIWSYPLGSDTSREDEITYFETGFKFMNMDDSQKNALDKFITGLD